MRPRAADKIGRRPRPAVHLGKPEPRPAPADEASPQGWYLAEANHGQQLLNAGKVGEAAGVFKALLARVGDAPSFERAAILERLGICIHLGGRPDLAAGYFRAGMAIVEALPPADAVKSLRGTLHSALGDVLRATGELGDARRAYKAALRIAEENNDVRGQGLDLLHLGALALVEGNLAEAEIHYRAALLRFQNFGDADLEALAWHQLGRVFQGVRQWDEAKRHYQEAARIREQRGRLAGAAETWSQMAGLCEQAGEAEAAEAWHRKAIAADGRIGSREQLGRHLSSLARMLSHQQSRLAEARQVAEEAVRVGQTLDFAAPDAWEGYGVLADVIDQEAASARNDECRAALEAQALCYRQLQQQAPRIVMALNRLGHGPGYGRAALLERLAECLSIAGRFDLAIAHLREGIAIIGKLPAGDEMKPLSGMLHAGLGDVLRATGDHRGAREAYEAAFAIAEGLRDVRGQAAARRHLAPAPGQMREAHEADAPFRLAPFEVRVCEDVTTEHVFEPDLLLQGPRTRRIVRRDDEPEPLARDARPMLTPGARTCLDEEGTIRFCLAEGEPVLDRHPGCTILRRTGCEVLVSGTSDLLWRLVRRMDGAGTVGEILASVPEGERAMAERILSMLAVTGAIDVSGRAVGRFLHAATKKGVLPGGGLEKSEVMRLALDGGYRAYPGAPRLDVGVGIPSRLRDFHGLTRARRSSREYLGLSMSRGDFDALLHTACGVTGAMVRADSEVKLRAYPSSGALYAVEIYPVVLGVEGLPPAVYHYHAPENVLEVVRPAIERGQLIDAMLPVERQMVSGAAAVICLTGNFVRHERKYGEGGYRMMVAEAGHVSQNLILAATALGLSARPFGGVFDSLLNQELGLDETNEQFLLAVLVGGPEGRGGP